jgi:phosphoribosylanthranilate isomerase
MEQQRTRIKFCGITRAEDAQAAVALGVDALGFVLVPGSPRWIEPQAANGILRGLPPLVSVVALLQDAAAAQVQAAIDALRPDLLQFHGAETPEFCASFGLPYLKAVAMRGLKQPLAQLALDYAGAAALLLDGHAAGEQGGQGRSFDWAGVTAGLGKPLILAGGLNPDNVAEAIRTVRPYAVDVSSGIEAKPGIKDSGKMAAFVRQVRAADPEF